MFPIAAKLFEAKPPHLLIITKDQELYRRLSKAFGNDCRITYVGDEQEGLGVVREIMPELVIADLLTNSNQGIEFCSRLKSEGLTHHITVILLANKARKAYQLSALKAGASEFFTSPFHMPSLKFRVFNILELSRKLHSHLDRSPLPVMREQKFNELDHQFAKRIRSVVEQNISNWEFGVGKLATKISVSRRQLLRKTKETIGTTPQTLIRSMRLERAAQLLKEHRLTICEITYAVGFTDLKHFREIFQKQYGLLPREYSNQYRQCICMSNQQRSV